MQQGSMNIDFGISADVMESSYMNATLSTLGEGVAINVAVTLAPPEGLDITDETAVADWLRESFSSLVANGAEIEVQVGPDGYKDDDDDDDEDE